MPIEDLSPPTDKFNRLQTPKSTKISDAPESMRTCTGESFNIPSTTADPKLDGAEARKGRCTDETGPVFFFHLSEFFFYPLLGRARFLGRCRAAIRLSHRAEPSGRAVRGEVDGLDIGGRFGRRFVLLRHTHRPQRRPYLICTSRNGNVRHRCGGG